MAAGKASHAVIPVCPYSRLPARKTFVAVPVSLRTCLKKVQCLEFRLITITSQGNFNYHKLRCIRAGNMIDQALAPDTHGNQGFGHDLTPLRTRPTSHARADVFPPFQVLRQLIIKDRELIFDSSNCIWIRPTIQTNIRLTTSLQPAVVTPSR